MPKRLDHKGFAALEALLIVIILGVLSGVGYYVYHAQTKSSDTLNAANLASESPTVTKSNYLEIKEWGVKLNVGRIKDATYKIVGNNQAFLQTELLKKDKKCANYYTPDFPSFVFIVRAKATDPPVFGDIPADPAPKTVQAAVNEHPSHFAKLNGYYYYSVHGNGMACGNADENALDKVLILPTPKLLPAH